MPSEGVAESPGAANGNRLSYFLIHGALLIATESAAYIADRLRSDNTGAKAKPTPSAYDLQR